MDKKTNKPVPDVNVYLANNSRGSFTNSKGYFQLEVEESDTLTISHIGYVNSQILAPKQAQFTMRMDKDYRNIRLYLVLFPDYRDVDALDEDELSITEVRSNSTITSNSDSPFNVEEYGEYPGGDRKLNQDLGNSLLSLRSIVKKRTEPLVIHFEINEEGVACNITHDLTDEKAVKKINNAFKKLAKWTPGTQREKVSSQYYRVTVTID